ncbi:hypothetical protein ILUMI_24016 [Ignelater luminosus]|uniref:Uncharacterized protein n=1 Tax=Ignelater luminosus TaxID=2038154 RepID=A0A8K0CEA1_IGNLU|nr:hypothetical protein ILUMI_24016 [Ignelater luminosus]
MIMVRPLNVEQVATNEGLQAFPLIYWSQIRRCTPTQHANRAPQANSPFIEVKVAWSITEPALPKQTTVIGAHTLRL